MVCKFVKDSREFVLDEGEHTPTHAFVSCDGEAKQIEVFQERDMLDLLDAHNVLLVKTPASCSAICQPSDVSTFFKASKKKLEYMPRSSRVGAWKLEGVEMPRAEEDQMEEALGALYQNAFVKAKLLQALRNTRFAHDKKERVVDALQRIIWAIRDTLKLSTVTLDGGLTRHSRWQCESAHMTFPQRAAT